MLYMYIHITCVCIYCLKKCCDTFKIEKHQHLSSYLIKELIVSVFHFPFLSFLSLNVLPLISNNTFCIK